MQKISVCLWFDNNAEEAMNFYLNVFRNSKVIGISRYGKGMPLPEGTVLTANFILNRMEILALNGGPMFKLSEAASLVVHCETQQEIDEYWEKLSDGGEKQVCGWLKDKFGLSWQIVPASLGEMMLSKDAKKTQRLMEEIQLMTKPDIRKLEEAFNQA
jgi:predicted 3-demethylubiquinone-9 3-methyltransferase (glyoxalase superfamily)